MGCALPFPLALSLVLQATADLDLGLRAESRSSTLALSGGPAETRTGVSAEPRATFGVDTSRVRLQLAYLPRLWTSDVGERQSPIVNHVVEARAETPHDQPFRAEAFAVGTRGRTDPLTEAQHAVAAGRPPAQLASALTYEALRTGARGELQLDPTTAVSAGAEWNASRGLSAEALVLVPDQRGVGLDASVSRRVSERDTLRVTATAAGTLTDAPVGETTGATATATANWRRRLTPYADGWIGAGVGIAYTDEPALAPARDVLPVGEVGLARAGADLAVAVEVAARLTTFVDRVNGQVGRMAAASGSLVWRAAERLSLAASASGGVRTDGETALAGADAHATWTLRPRLAVEAGVVGRWQHERRPEVPSLTETGVVVALTYATGRL